jgi:hypothetical protein
MFKSVTECNVLFVRLMYFVAHACFDGKARRKETSLKTEA